MLWGRRYSRRPHRCCAGPRLASCAPHDSASSHLPPHAEARPTGPLALRTPVAWIWPPLPIVLGSSHVCIRRGTLAACTPPFPLDPLNTQLYTFKMETAPASKCLRDRKSLLSYTHCIKSVKHVVLAPKPRARKMMVCQPRKSGGHTIIFSSHRRNIN